jgi:tRNA threonylcarbamoyl adenosine modification protein YeaZ
LRVLALDTATEACSVALLTDEGLFGLFKEVGRGHAEQILGMVDAVLGEAGCVLGRLDGIAASVGPGAFTGVRISVSVAQGLAFGAGVPVVAVSTLEALALHALRGGADQAMACLDARMGEVYWGCFSADSLRAVRRRSGPPLRSACLSLGPSPASAAASGPTPVSRRFRASFYRLAHAMRCPMPETWRGWARSDLKPEKGRTRPI